MSSTHLSLHYHIVFGTKSHEPMIQAAWRDKLHAYLGTQKVEIVLALGFFCARLLSRE